MTAAARVNDAVQLHLLDLPKKEAHTATEIPAAGVSTLAQRRSLPRKAGATIPCGWCGTPTLIPPRGRTPKWCSATCRHRAWEQRRAAESGLSAIEIVGRIVETTKIEKQEPETAPPPATAQPHSVDQFASALLDLANRLDTLRIYDRDLARIDPAITALLDARVRRRTGTRR